MKDYIYQTFQNQPLTLAAGKKYCTNSITDHTPVTRPELLKQIITEMTSKIDFLDADFLVGEEDRGGYLCALMSIPWNKPFTLTKWYPGELHGDVMVTFKNSYTTGSLYLNGIKKLKGKKVIIVEDLIDTGGTIIAMVQLLRQNGVEVLDIVAVASKTDYNGLERIEKETGIKPKVLVSFSCNGPRSKVVERYI